MRILAESAVEEAKVRIEGRCKHGYRCVARSTGSKTRKRDVGREFSPWGSNGGRRGARDDRMVRNPAGTIDVRHLRCLPGRVGPASSPRGTGRRCAESESLRIVRTGARDREGRCSGGQTSCVAGPFDKAQGERLKN